MKKFFIEQVSANAVAIFNGKREENLTALVTMQGPMAMAAAGAFIKCLEGKDEGLIGIAMEHLEN